MGGALDYPQFKMTVLWLDIKGYDGLYKISNEGDVMRLYKDSRRANRYGKSRILKPSFTKGYAHVTLSKNDQQETRRIARMVAEAFIPNPKGKPEVNHKDGNKANDCDWNLEWATESENTQHAVDTGLRARVQGVALQTQNGRTPWNKGKKTGQVPWNKGRCYLKENNILPDCK